MSDITLSCGFGCSSIDGCLGQCADTPKAAPMRYKKTPKELRCEIAQMIRREANIADGMGDPEGAGRLRDIARDIDRIRLTGDA